MMVSLLLPALLATAIVTVTAPPPPQTSESGPEKKHEQKTPISFQYYRWLFQTFHLVDEQHPEKTVHLKAFSVWKNTMNGDRNCDGTSKKDDSTFVVNWKECDLHATEHLRKIQIKVEYFLDGEPNNVHEAHISLAHYSTAELVDIVGSGNGKSKLIVNGSHGRIVVEKNEQLIPSNATRPCAFACL